MKVAITGATGFVGSALIEALKEYPLTFIGRRSPLLKEPDAFFQIDITPDAHYGAAFSDVGVIIHTAARAHIMNDAETNPLETYRKINTAGTLNLAHQAAAAGVKRFIFISSIKVNGEATRGDAFRFDDMPMPEDAYGISKAEAEECLWEVAKNTGMEVVIIRPPLVYGFGVKANFAAMMKLAQKNWPLPLGAIHNKRSLVALDNLVDLIVTCIDHPKAANQTFLVSDDNDVSTSELLKMMICAVGKKPRLIPVPMNWIKFAAMLLGKKAVADRLCGSLQVDISHTKETLDWVPRVTVEEGIRRCFYVVDELRVAR